MSYKVLNENTEFKIDDTAYFGDNVTFGKNCKKVEIGKGCFIGSDIYIDCDYLTIGDFSTIHHGSVVHGINTTIGHNCWFGHYTIIDSVGGKTIIGNNVGVGAHSQLWSHMKFGDVLEGCRWNSAGRLILEDDVWLVGRSMTGPIHAKKKSMLMAGGIAVKNMDENCIYAGSPAKDVTEKFGNQFKERSLDEKKQMFLAYCEEYASQGGDVSSIELVDDFDVEKSKNGISQFNLQNRTYYPCNSKNEFGFIKFMLYEKAKFLPFGREVVSPLGAN